MLVLGSCFGLLATSCAANLARSGTDLGVTNLQASDWTPEAESRAQGSVIDPRTPVIDPRTTEAANALGARDYDRVIALTEAPSTAPTGAWLDYERAAAFSGLRRTDEAVEVFKRAELRFRDAGDDAGHSVAIWGRARALYQAGRCAEARSAYEEYAAFVRQADPGAAEMALATSDTCRGRVILR